MLQVTVPRATVVDVNKRRPHFTHPGPSIPFLCFTLTFLPFMRYLIWRIQLPSMCATTLSLGTCFGFFQDSASVSPVLYR